MKGSCVARNDSQAMSSIGSPRWASSQSTTAVTRPPAYMKLPGPVSPCTRTSGPSYPGTFRRSHDNEKVSAGSTVPPRADSTCSHSSSSAWTASATVSTAGKSGRSSDAASSACKAASLVMKSCAVASRLVRIGEAGEPVLARHPLRQHGLVHRVHAEHPGDRHRRVLQGEIHAGLAVQRPGVLGAGGVGAVVAQEARRHRPVGMLQVDEPGLLPRPARLAVRRHQPPPTHLLHPGHQVVGQGQRHGSAHSRR